MQKPSGAPGPPTQEGTSLQDLIRAQWAPLAAHPDIQLTERTVSCSVIIRNYHDATVRANSCVTSRRLQVQILRGGTAVVCRIQAEHTAALYKRTVPRILAGCNWSYTQPSAKKISSTSFKSQYCWPSNRVHAELNDPEGSINSTQKQ